MNKEKIELKIIKCEINEHQIFDITDQHGNKYEMIGAVEFEKTGKFVAAKVEFMFIDEDGDLPCGKYRLEPQHIPHIRK